MSFLASPTLRLLLASLAISGLALTGCSGQAGATCQQASDCASGLVCSNYLRPDIWPRGTCVVGNEFDANVGADVFTAPDAFSADDAFGADAFVPVDAHVINDAFVGNDTFTEDARTEADAGAADAAVDASVDGG